ncbi:MAG: recombinase RecA [Fimbriimonadales bacterium]|jgi:recombination protein RecA|nr:recombinase RecA [Fimbriimonadales bacterium]GBC91416.1 Protein RecA [bacterium HR14]CUU04486.1 recombination protein RecA [Armatimonadetes bacterium GBS]CUU37522.1 recombination protein RecA [Armatimonadetes bacterium GXS]
MTNQNEKQKALEAVLSQVERQFGKGSVMRLGDATRLQVDVIPTGSTALDMALGVGGIPRGRIIEIYGTESSGKTTLGLHIIAEAQKRGGNALFVDAEHALDPDYARAIGVDVDKLYIAQPSTGDEALEIMDMLIRSGAFDVAVLDSVAALIPRQEVEGDIGDVTVGAQARLMSQALRKLGASAAKSNTAVIFINQIREKVGVMYGNPETTPGGRALKFWASVRLEVRRVDNIKQGNEIIGVRTRVKVVKNKVAPPFRQAEFDVIFGKGISKLGDLLDQALMLGIIKKSGTWFSFGDMRLGQGRENARAYLEEHPEVVEALEEAVRAYIQQQPVTAVALAETADEAEPVAE